MTRRAQVLWGGGVVLRAVRFSTSRIIAASFPVLTFQLTTREYDPNKMLLMRDSIPQNHTCVIRYVFDVMCVPTIARVQYSQCLVKHHHNFISHSIFDLGSGYGKFGSSHLSFYTTS